jgi:hypothetical protein
MPRVGLTNHDLVPVRVSYPEFLSRGFNRLILVFSLNDSEILILRTELHTPTIHFAPR